MANPRYYRTEDPYERIPMHQLAKINNEDPWFGLGYLLAQGYNHAYNQRGIDKGIEAGNEMINEALGESGQPAGGQAEPASDVLYNAAERAGVLSPHQDNGTPQERAQKAVMGDTPKLSMDGNAPQAQAPKTPEEVSKQQPEYQEKATKAVMGEPTIDSGPTKEQLKADKYAYFVDKYSGSPNPDGDANAARSFAATAEQQLQRLNALQGFNKQQLRSNIEQRLIADGRPSNQREAILESLDPILDAKEKSVNDELFGLYNNAYQARVQAGDFAGAQSLVPSMARYNPQLASAAVAGVPTLKDQWTLANEREDAATRQQYALGRMDHSLANAIELADHNRMAEYMQRYNSFKLLYPNVPDATLQGMALSGADPTKGAGGKGGAGGSGGGVSASTQLSAAKDIMSRGDKWASESRRPITEWENYDQYQHASKLIDELTGFDPEAAKNSPNYNTGMKELTDVLMNPDKPPREAVERALRAKYGDLADKMIADADWDAFYGSGDSGGSGSASGLYGAGRTAGGFR